ncbi:DUF6541 family protein [Arthrobacter sp. QXT-31]|uniref:DUF6541 family protein n=1 Tax=Arthrobacter sp. QXT-31 TaxID=1357915 RepID=UPI00156037A6|nr:DUF6541 family protein [Arthrobacter sp. QXT-31]
MSWLETLPAVFVALAIVLLPGAALAWGLGIRRLSLFGLAPLFSLTLAGVGAVIAAWLGVPWSPAVVLAITVLATAGAWFLVGRRAALDAAAPEKWPLVAGVAAAIAVTALMVGRRITQLVGAPDNISQRYDNVFHLNAVRYVLDTENASSLDLGRMGGNGSGRATIYPAVWHSLCAMVTQVTGTEIAVSVNVVNLVAGAVIWPLSVVFLTRVILGPRLMALAAAAVLSGGFVAFPYLLMVWGPLFPNLLSASVLPAALATVILVCRIAPDTDEPRLRSWLALLVGLPGLALSHMSSVNALLAFSAPMLLWKLAVHVRGLIRARAPLGKYILPVAATVLAAAAAAVIWKLVRPGFYGGWKPHQTVPGAIGEVVSNAPAGTDVAILTSILALIGIATIVRRRTLWWLLACYVVAGYLYVVDAGYEAGWARDFFTGTWYQDVNRLAAYLPIFAVVLAALGVTAVVEAVRSMISRQGGRLQSLFPARRAAFMDVRGIRLPDLAGGVVVCALLLVLTQTGTVRDYIVDNKIFYQRDTKESILSSDEYRLLDRLPAEVPEDAVIAVNPWNGGSLAYAFADRKVLEYHQTQRMNDDLRIIAQDLANAASDPKVCAAVRKLQVTYALDFGEQYLLNHPSSRMYPGLQDLEKSRSLQLVDSEGEAKLYKVTACG